MNIKIFFISFFLSSYCLSSGPIIENLYKDYKKKVCNSGASDENIITDLERIKATNTKTYKKFLKAKDTEASHEYLTCFALKNQRARLFEYFLDNHARLSSYFFKNPIATIRPYFRDIDFAEQFTPLIRRALKQKGLSKSDIKEFFGSVYIECFPNFCAQLKKSNLERDQGRDSLEQEKQKLEAIRGQLRTREEELADVSDVLTTQDQELKSKSQTLLAKDKEIQTVYEQLQKRGQELEDATKNLSTQTQELQKSAQTLLTKEQEVERVHDQLKISEQELRQARSDLDIQSQELKSRAQTILTQDKEIQAVRDHLKTREEEFKKGRKDLNTRVQDLRRRLQVVSGKEDVKSQPQMTVQRFEEALHTKMKDSTNQENLPMRTDTSEVDLDPNTAQSQEIHHLKKTNRVLLEANSKQSQKISELSQILIEHYRLIKEQEEKITGSVISYRVQNARLSNQEYNEKNTPSNLRSTSEATMDDHPQNQGRLRVKLEEEIRSKISPYVISGAYRVPLSYLISYMKGPALATYSSLRGSVNGTSEAPYKRVQVEKHSDQILEQSLNNQKKAQDYESEIRQLKRDNLELQKRIKILEKTIVKLKSGTM